MGSEQITGAHNEQYDLISIRHHSTHGAWNCAHDTQDAEEKSAQEPVDFIGEMRDRNAQVARRANQLLNSRPSLPRVGRVADPDLSA